MKSNNILLDFNKIGILFFKQFFEEIFLNLIYQKMLINLKLFTSVFIG